jgi:uncharacterized protein (TIGR02246 family)
MARDEQKAFEQVVAELNAAITQAFNRGDVRACVEAYAEDAALYVSGRPPLKGRDKIRPMLQEWVSLGMTLGPVEVLDIRASGDMGYCAGTYEFRMPPSVDAPERKEGKFVTVFMRQADGSWKTVMDCLTDN